MRDTEKSFKKRTKGECASSSPPLLFELLPESDDIDFPVLEIRHEGPSPMECLGVRILHQRPLHETLRFNDMPYRLQR